jgi:hypothetical protein
LLCHFEGGLHNNSRHGSLIKEIDEDLLYEKKADAMA